MKIRLLISLVLSRYGLACKYGIIFQKSIYSWMENFLVPGITIANHARLKLKHDSSFWLVCFLSLFCIKDQIQFMFVCSFLI